MKSKICAPKLTPDVLRCLQNNRKPTCRLTSGFSSRGLSRSGHDCPTHSIYLLLYDSYSDAGNCNTVFIQSGTPGTWYLLENLR